MGRRSNRPDWGSSKPPARRGDDAASPAPIAPPMPGDTEASLRIVQTTESTMRALTEELSGLLDGALHTLAASREDLAELANAETSRLGAHLETLGESLKWMNTVMHDTMQSPRGIATPAQQEPLVDALWHATESVKLTAESRRIDLSLDCSPRLVLLPAGPLYTVAANAIRNAMESVVVGGRIEIIAEMATDEGVAPFVQIDVFDTGAGPSAHSESHAFDPRYTTKQNKYAERLARGVGLALSQDLVQTLGGQILLQSLPESGLSTPIDAHDHTPPRHGPGARLMVRVPAEALKRFAPNAADNDPNARAA